LIRRSTIRRSRHQILDSGHGAEGILHVFHCEIVITEIMVFDEGIFFAVDFHRQSKAIN
jgi:hypothetical protein